MIQDYSDQIPWPAFPNVDDQLTRLLENTIKDDRRLMRALVQATTVEQKLAAENAIEKRLKECDT